LKKEVTQGADLSFGINQPPYQSDGHIVASSALFIPQGGGGVT